MGAAFVYLDQSGKTRAVKQTSWENGIRKGHWGRYGAWTMFNLNHMDLSVVVTDAAHYAGDGYFYGWHIRWS